MRFDPLRRRRTPTQPTPTAVSPSSGAEGETITITLAPAYRPAVVTSVQLGAYACTTVAQSSDGATVTCVIAAGTPAATYDVIVFGPGGLGALYSSFTVAGGNGILTEASEPITTEAGDPLIQEAA